MLIYLLEWNKLEVSMMTAINKILIYFKLLYGHSALFVKGLTNTYVASREILHYFYDFNFNEERSKKV